jgi:hypothetical protein
MRDAVLALVPSKQQLNCEQRLFFGNDHVSEQARVIFGVCRTALSATKTPKTIAVLPKLRASEIADWAIPGKQHDSRRPRTFRMRVHCSSLNARLRSNLRMSTLIVPRTEETTGWL